MELLEVSNWQNYGKVFVGYMCDGVESVRGWVWGCHGGRDNAKVLVNMVAWEKQSWLDVMDGKVLEGNWSVRAISFVLLHGGAHIWEKGKWGMCGAVG